MRFSINQNMNKQCICVECPLKKPHFVFSLLHELGIKNVSTFIDENSYYFFKKNAKYTLCGKPTVDELFKNEENFRNPLLIFDGEIDECYVNNEFDVFNKCKIMIDIDIEKNAFIVFINTSNTDLSLQRIKQLKHDN